MIHESAQAFARPIALGDVADARARLHETRSVEPALPPELAALERAGIAPGPLHAALAEARRVGVWPFDALLASGQFTEEDLVEAFARATGVDVAGPEDANAGPVDANDYALACWSGHLVAIDARGEPRLVIAARGPAMRKLALSRRGSPRTRAIAVAGPQGFADVAIARAGERLALRAAEGPSRITPDLTVAGGMPSIGPTGQAGLGAAAVALAAALVVVPGLFATLLVLCGLLFAASNGFRFALSLTRPEDRRRTPRADDADLPIYTVMAALHREGAVVASLLEAIERIDYPAAKLDVKILVEQGDDETLAALRRRPPRAGVEVLVLPPGGPRTKPRALNAGLLSARGEFITVYDAEDRPDPRQLRTAVAAFRRSGPDLACVQAKLAIDNLDDGWLVRHYAIEYAALFYVILPALAALRLPIPLGGTSNHFRAKALRQLGGWDAGNVTEDADLGMRLAGAGFRAETIHSVTWEEAPITREAWLKQRTRWMKGYMVTAIVHGRRPKRLIGRIGLPAFAAAQFAIAGVALSALAYPLAVVLFIVSGLTGHLLAPSAGPFDSLLWCFHILSMIVGFASALACGWMGVDRRLPPSVGATLFTLPFYWALVGCAAWRALWQIVSGETSHWEKTTHGVSTRRRTPPA